MDYVDTVNSRYLKVEVHLKQLISHSFVYLICNFRKIFPREIFSESCKSSKQTLNFSAFHWSPHGSLVAIGQHFITTRVFLTKDGLVSIYNTRLSMDRL